MVVISQSVLEVLYWSDMNLKTKYPASLTHWKRMFTLYSSGNWVLFYFLFSQVLAFILATVFASTCNGRPTPTGDQWNLKDLGKRSQLLGEEILDSISMKTRPKRQVIKTTFERNVRLQSRSQWFLAIEDDGTIKGSANFNSLNGESHCSLIKMSLSCCILWIFYKKAQLLLQQNFHVFVFLVKWQTFSMKN
jgi:hypothetical protein